MKDLESILNVTNGDPQQKNLRGVAQAMKAFYFGMFVDLFGSVPYTEAFKGDDLASPTSQPKFDTDKDIYESLISLCDSAAANLTAKSFVALSNDIVYGNDIAKWKKFSNTVKLKLIFNSRRVRAKSTENLTTIFAKTADIIYTPADNFVWNYTTTASPADRRHPWYLNAYPNANNEFTYFNQEWITDMVDYADPRLYYYTFPQIDFALNPADPTQRGAIPYAYTPYNQQDGQYRLTVGAYPADGLHWSKGPVQLGSDFSGAAAGGRTGRGAGVFPLLTANHVKFWLVESVLVNGVPGDARKLFEEAMRDNFKVISDFSVAKQASAAISATAIDKYVALFLKRFDDATSAEQKLNVVLKQARYANFGNGMEMYNAMRRTGYPSDVRTPRTRIRQFALRMPYAADELSLNKNAPQGESVIFDRDAIFWDVVKFKF
jgi:hypothetical protein